MRLRGKMLLGFFVVALCGASVGGFALLRLASIRQESQASATSGREPLVTVSELQHELDRSVSLAQALLYPNPKRTAEASALAVKDFPLHTAATTPLLKQLRDDDLSTEADTKLGVAVTKVSSLLKVSDRMLGTHNEILDPNAPDPAAEKTPATIEEAAAAIADLRAQLVSDAAAHDVAVDEKIGGANSALVAVILAMVAIAAAIALGLTHRIVGKIPEVVAVLRQAAGGDLTGRVLVTGSDEVAMMGAALNETLDATGGLIASIRTSAEQLGEAAAGFDERTDELAGAARRVADEATQASARTAEVTNEVATVAAGTEQMGASVHEIATHANHATEVARRAVDVADGAMSTVGNLRTSSDEIGKVLALIQDIAEQTNLLALNATIESARAGLAGKGFAVVASEVKELSSATTRATRDIAGRVATIQADSRQASEAMNEISAVIGEISAIQASIAGAVEEQTAVTSEIGRSTSDVAQKADHINGSIETMVATVTRTAGAVESNRADAERLVETSRVLREAVARFAILDPS